MSAGYRIRWEAGDRAEAPSGAEVLRRVHPDGSIELLVRRTTRGYEIDGQDVARIHVPLDDAGEIIVRTFAPELSDAAADLLTHYILPHLRQLRGMPAIHASAVAIDGRVVGFMGRSGMGKSTLATSFRGRGAFVTDDALLLDPQEDRVIATPLRPSVRLRDDSIASIAPDAGARELGGKREVELEGPGGPLPLARLYALDLADQVEITPITQRDALLTLATHLHRIDPTDQTLLAREVDFLEAIARRVRVARLAFPRRYEILPDVRRAILDDIAPQNDGP